MSRSMRTRTAYCPHGFFIPGKPEPWLIPRAKDGEDLKASRFCLQCWEKHGQVFLARGYTHIITEDACQYGFLNLIQYVLKNHAWYRDQDRYEFLETELRMHLLEKRKLIEKAIRERPDTAKAYVREALLNKLQDLQKTSEFNVQQFSDTFDENQGEKPDFNPEDENHNAARIVDATGGVDPFTSTESDSIARSHRAARSITANRLTESEEELFNAKDPLKEPGTTDEERRNKKARAKENAELVRAAIEEQSHRLDALTIVTEKEKRREVKTAHAQLLHAVEKLPDDEQTAIRLRFLDGNGLRDGKPRSRSDILRELRINGNGNSGWSEWDLRTLEQQAVLRLRSQITLPAIFKNRD